MRPSPPSSPPRSATSRRIGPSARSYSPARGGRSRRGRTSAIAPRRSSAVTSSISGTSAGGATEAYALTKEGLNAAWERDFTSFLEVEAALQDRAGRTHDYAEGVRAFLGKRPAGFSGS